jgi:outer membrane protein assembly factor BamB
MRVPKFFLPRATCVLCALGAADAFAADWLQWGYDPAHSGNNPDEATLDASNVAQLTRRYQITMSSTANAAPVFASAIETPSGTKDLLFVTARSGRLTAFDAMTGDVVWSADTSGTSPTESSPAIDPNRQFVYGYGIDGKAHKYRIGDGTEITSDGWPQIATLKPNVEKGASAISWGISNGTTYLYVANNGYVGDGGDYQGHLTTINLATNEQKVFNSLCSDITIHMVLNGTPGVNDCGERQSGIWGRPGATYDAVTDRVYITTANGLFDANIGGLNWGDSVLALHPDGTGQGAGFPLDSYTPTNYSQLDGQDIDLGSASLTILPMPAESVYQHVGVETGKDSRLHLINLDDMSSTGAPGGVGGAIGVIDVPVSEFWMKTNTSAWVDTQGDGATWVFVGNGSGVSGLKVQLHPDNKPFLQPTWTKSTSATSTITANGVIYHIGSCSGGNCVIARNPRNGDVLWTSQTIGNIRWESPIVVNGAVYAVTGTKLNRFDLGAPPAAYTVTPIAGDHGSIAPDTPQTVNENSTVAFTITPDAHYRIADVTGCGGSLDGSTYTTAPITADCNVNATFEIVTHTVTPDAGDNGSLTPDTPQTVDDGATTAFTVTPAPSYVIESVSGCNGTLEGSVYTTGAITGDCTVTATFAADGPGDPIFGNGFDPAP